MKDRREFFKKLGLGIGALTVPMLNKISEAKEVFKEEPEKDGINFDYLKSQIKKGFDRNMIVFDNERSYFKYGWATNRLVNLMYQVDRGIDTLYISDYILTDFNRDELITMSEYRKRYIEIRRIEGLYKGEELYNNYFNNNNLYGAFPNDNANSLIIGVGLNTVLLGCT